MALILMESPPKKARKRKQKRYTNDDSDEDWDAEETKALQKREEAQQIASTFKSCQRTLCELEPDCDHIPGLAFVYVKLVRTLSTEQCIKVGEAGAFMATHRNLYHIGCGIHQFMRVRESQGASTAIRANRKIKRSQLHAIDWQPYGIGAHIYHVVSVYGKFCHYMSLFHRQDITELWKIPLPPGALTMKLKGYDLLDRAPLYVYQPDHPFGLPIPKGQHWSYLDSWTGASAVSSISSSSSSSSTSWCSISESSSSPAASSSLFSVSLLSSFSSSSSSTNSAFVSMASSAAMVDSEDDF
jgi:hypothetical protein